MTKEELAARLHGREYGSETNPGDEAEAAAAGLVIVFGYSDDNVELRGAANDEIGMYNGGCVRVTSDGHVVPDWESIDHSDQDEARTFFRLEAMPCASIDCEFSPAGDDVTWRYTTVVPHAKFDVMEDGETYCRGIVFALADIVQGKATGAQQ